MTPLNRHLRQRGYVAGRVSVRYDKYDLSFGLVLQVVPGGTGAIYALCQDIQDEFGWVIDSNRVDSDTCLLSASFRGDKQQLVALLGSENYDEDPGVVWCDACVNCGYVRRRHGVGQCLFSPTRFVPTHYAGYLELTDPHPHRCISEMCTSPMTTFWWTYGGVAV